ncbi:hypothetical protein EMIT0P44_480018 [Pseudomonas sp. IT-P44]
MHRLQGRHRQQAGSYKGFVAGTGKVNNTIHCRSRLAGDEAREFCIDFKAAIAGKPAPTRVWWRARKR